MSISAATYERVALEDPHGGWELVCGQLRQKPPMTTEHQSTIRQAAEQFHDQIDRENYAIDTSQTRVRISDESYLIPDLCSLPRELIRRRREHPRELEIFDDPLPLIVEVWSPSTGERDRTEKLDAYRRRGDREIWLIHPYERWLHTWRRQPDGSYAESLFRGDETIEPLALPGVRIALASLFA
jgi:Uma2 family endonuclease